MSESQIIPGTETGSFDEIKGICDAVSIDTNLTTLISDNGYVGTTISSHGLELINQLKHPTPSNEVKPSNFEMCAEINHLVGNVVKRTHETMLHQKKIIEGEWDEMCESVEVGNIDTLRDDIADVLFTVYGMAARLGIPADLDFKKVCESQFTKFDNTIDEALATRDKYLEMGITTYYDEQIRKDGTKIYVTYSAINQTGKDNKSYPAGKWLKSCNYKEPIFDPLEK